MFRQTGRVVAPGAIDAATSQGFPCVFIIPQEGRQDKPQFHILAEGEGRARERGTLWKDPGHGCLGCQRVTCDKMSLVIGVTSRGDIYVTVTGV
jgi:hypothetical protein